MYIIRRLLRGHCPLFPSSFRAFVSCLACCWIATCVPQYVRSEDEFAVTQEDGTLREEYDSSTHWNQPIVYYDTANFTDCTRRCTIHDKNIDCWENSLTYYSKQLHRSLNEYVGTLLYIQRWRSYKPDQPSVVSIAKKVLKTHIEERAQTSRKKNPQPLTEEELLDFFEHLLNKTEDMFERHRGPRHTVLPSFACPIPCSYETHLWKILFLVTLTACILCALTVVCYMSVSALRSRKAHSYTRAIRT